MKSIKHFTSRLKQTAVAGVASLCVAASTFAADAAPSAAKQAAGDHMKHGGNSSMMLIMLLLIVAFYFLMIRPQTKRAKAHRQLIGDIGVGDEVVTTAGLIGAVTRLSDAYVVLSVADGAELTFQKSALATVLPKGTIESIK